MPIVMATVSIARLRDSKRRTLYRHVDMTHHAQYLHFELNGAVWLVPANVRDEESHIGCKVGILVQNGVLERSL